MPIVTSSQIMTETALKGTYKNKCLKLHLNENSILEVPFMQNQSHNDATTHFKNVSSEKVKCIELHTPSTHVRSSLHINGIVHCDLINGRELHTSKLHCNSMISSRLQTKALHSETIVSEKVHAKIFTSQELHTQKAHTRNLKATHIQSQSSHMNTLTCTTSCTTNNINSEIVDLTSLDTKKLMPRCLQVCGQTILPASHGTLTCTNNHLHWTNAHPTCTFNKSILSVGNTDMHLTTTHQSCDSHGTLFHSQVHTDSLQSELCRGDIKASRITSASLNCKSIHADTIKVSHHTGMVHYTGITVAREPDLNLAFSNNQIHISFESQSVCIDVPTIHQCATGNTLAFDDMSLLMHTCNHLDCTHAQDVNTTSAVSEKAVNVKCNNLFLTNLSFKPSIVSVTLAELHMLDATYHWKFPVLHQSCTYSNTQFQKLLLAKNCTIQTLKSESMNIEHAQNVNISNATILHSHHAHLQSCMHICINKHTLFPPKAPSILQFKSSLQWLSVHQHSKQVQESLFSAIRNCKWPLDNQSSDCNGTYFGDLSATTCTAHTAVCKIIETTTLNAQSHTASTLSALLADITNLHCKVLNIHTPMKSTTLPYASMTGENIVIHAHGNEFSFALPFQNQTCDSNHTAFINLNATSAHCTNLQATTLSMIHTDSQMLTAINANAHSLSTNVHKSMYLSASTHNLLRLTQVPNLKQVCVGISNDLRLIYDTFEIHVAGWPFKNMHSELKKTSFLHEVSFNKVNALKVRTAKLHQSAHTTAEKCTSKLTNASVHAMNVAGNFAQCKLPLSLPCDLPDVDSILVCDGVSAYWEPIFCNWH